MHQLTYLTDDINLVADSGRRLLRSAVDRTCVYHTPTICSATRVSLLLVRMCGTVCHQTYDETLATDSENWKHFCLGVNWPRRIVAVLYLLTYWHGALLWQTSNGSLIKPHNENHKVTTDWGNCRLRHINIAVLLIWTLAYMYCSCQQLDRMLREPWAWLSARLLDRSRGLCIYRVGQKTDPLY